MTAIVLAEVRLKNPEKMGEYSAAAGPTIAQFGGKLVQRGKFVEALVGAGDPHMLAIIEFPDSAAAKAWFNSPQYKAIIPIRDQAADVNFRLYEMLD
jgi:uncharacterized protein (DUF1330 family)